MDIYLIWCIYLEPPEHSFEVFCTILCVHVCLPPKAENSLQSKDFLFIFITSASSHLVGIQ